MLLCILALWVSMNLGLEKILPLRELPWLPLIVSMGLALPLFIRFGLYRAIFRHAGLNGFVPIARAMSLYTLVYASVFTLVQIPGVPRSIGVSQPVLLFLLVGLSRCAVRYWLSGMYLQLLSGSGKTHVLIYGAGSAGRQLAAGLSGSKDMLLIGYLDDDVRLQGQILNGTRIFGAADLSALISKHNVSLVLLALPSATRQQRNEILDKLGQFHLQVRTLPPLRDLTGGRVLLDDLKELDLHDLLGRDSVAPQELLMGHRIRGKTVMVTGAGGSIGAELCRQILRVDPAKLLLVELNEFALYAIHQELERVVLQELGTNVDIIPLLGNVRDGALMGEILSTWQPSTLFHAAAYKHVPLVEHNPAEGIRNNVFGTHTLVLQAVLYGVSDVVLISTDKAVRPTNVMGASKRLAEMVLQAQAENLRQN